MKIILSVLIFFLVVPLLLQGQQYWGTTPTVNSNGVMEIGRIIDFHETSDDPNDFSARLFSSGGVLKSISLFNPASLLVTDPSSVTDWNLLWQSGFFDGSNAANAPESSGWFWGINMNHRSNGTEYRYNGQLAIKNSPTSPTMYFRSTNVNGEGIWTKVLHNNGSQQINGSLKLYSANYIDFRLERDNGGYATMGVTSNSLEAFLSSGGSLKFLTGGATTPKIFIKENGDVGIGTTIPDSKLTVKGTIHTQEIKVDLSGALVPDYVFEEDYPLPSLPEIEIYIKANKHLPEIPSAKEMEENGMDLKRMNLLLLKKIEELTLYVIELKKENKELKSYRDEIDELAEKIRKLESR